MKQIELLEKLIRKVIREELEMTVDKHIAPLKESLNEVLSKNPKDILNDSKFESKLNSIKQSITQTTDQPTSTPVKQQPSFNLRNKILNEVLSNTVPLNEKENPPSVLDQIKPSMVADYIGKNQEEPIPPTPNTPGNSALEEIFNRDYTGLMEKMEEKKNFRP
jgi:hypothetical protein